MITSGGKRGKRMGGDGKEGMGSISDYAQS